MRPDDTRDFAERSTEAEGPLLWEPDPNGPFARSRMKPEANELVVADVIWRHKGRENPVSIARLSSITGLNERGVKSVVEQLVVTHKMLIGGRRGEPVGYFTIVDAADREMAVGPYRAQILSMFKRLRVLDEKHRVAELLGQLRIEE